MPDKLFSARAYALCLLYEGINPTQLLHLEFEIALKFANIALVADVPITA